MSKRVAEGPESPCGGVAARGGQESSSKPAIGALGTGESAAEVSERQAGLTGPIDYEGVVELEFVRRGDRSIAEHAYHRGANRLSASMPHDDPTVPYYFLITMGGGLIEGEHYRTELRVG